MLVSTKISVTGNKFFLYKALAPTKNNYTTNQNNLLSSIYEYSQNLFIKLEE